ncbi:MAG: hypothetical protein ACOC1V_02335 [Candidatus Saliniplasma sp.]
MKTLLIPDIHGNFEALKEVIIKMRIKDILDRTARILKAGKVVQ